MENTWKITYLKNKIYSEIAEYCSRYSINIRIVFIIRPLDSIGIFYQKGLLKINLLVFHKRYLLKQKCQYDFLIRYLKEYIKLLCVDIQKKPTDYFQGIAGLESFFLLNKNSMIKIRVPLMNVPFLLKKRGFLLAEQYCLWQAEKQSSIDHKSTGEQTLIPLFGLFPEIIYENKTMPFYSSLYFLQKIKDFSENDDSRNISQFLVKYISEFPSMKVTELFRNDNPFSVGLAVRLITFMPLSDLNVILTDEEAKKNIEKAVSEFQTKGKEYLQRERAETDQLLMDNDLAVMYMMKQLNRISMNYGLKTAEGNIHFFQ